MDKFISSISIPLRMKNSAILIVLIATAIIISGCTSGNNDSGSASPSQNPGPLGITPSNGGGMPVSNTSYGADRNSSTGQNFCGKSIGSCSTDSDCSAQGQYGQVCSSITVTSTGDNLSCYNAQEYNVKCGCVKGSCEWYSIS